MFGWFSKKQDASPFRYIVCDDAKSLCEVDAFTQVPTGRLLINDGTVDKDLIVSNNTRGAEATLLGYIAVYDGKILASEFMTYVAEQMDQCADVDVAASPDEDVSIELKNKLDGWIAESDEYGEDEVRNIEIMRGVKFNTEDRAFLVERFCRQKLDELEHEDEAERMALHAALFALPVEDVDERRHQELLDVIERGNVGAQAMDVAGRHPFLTGLLAPWLIDKVKGR